MTNATPLDAARERSLKMRHEEIALILRRNASPQLFGIDAALAVLDERPPSRRSLDARWVSDDGVTIRLTLYGETGAAAAAPLEPARTIALAGELVAAALPKLA
jgi:hypothetical protein